MYRFLVAQLKYKSSAWGVSVKVVGTLYSSRRGIEIYALWFDQHDLVQATTSGRSAPGAGRCQRQ